ncbi:MAG: metal-dependent hydrolase [Asgard group archaeon]|nr:metal-dependent hydrolase [Asgard group archaeon]
MDPITHLVLAYCFIFWIDKIKPVPKKFLIPFLIGSVLPDLDVVFDFLVYFAPKLFWLEHRAMSHSFVGIIPYVIITAAVFNLGKVRTIFWKEENYPDLKFWSWFGILVIYLGSLTHIFTDFFVPTGEMIFFPFSFKWYGIKILTTNNIHSIAAILFATTVWPLKWDARRRKIVFSFFIIVMTFYSSIRIASNLKSSKLFESKYGPGNYTSNEFIFTHNINYAVYNETDLNNRTFIITIIDGFQGKFISEELIPELRVQNSTDILTAKELVNLTRANAHYYRLKQKYLIVCAIALQVSLTDWIITWFAPIREAENTLKTEQISFRSSLDINYYISNDGTITKIDRPIMI